MKIAILCNHSYPHIGGSEVVVQNISKYLVSEFQYDVSVFSKTTINDFLHENVKYCSLNHLNNDLLLNVNKFDVILIYSDHFFLLNKILDNIQYINAKIILCTVGCTWLQHYPNYIELIKKNKRKIKIVAHSDKRPDYKIFGKLATVIPNSYDIGNPKLYFKNIDVKHDFIDQIPIINISNFFHSKAQEYLPLIMSRVKLKNTCLLQASSTINEPFHRVCEIKYKKLLKQYNINNRFLKDLNRNELMSVLNKSKLFLFPSVVEEAPLVILETMAHGVPFISMPVGNVINYKDAGIIVEPDGMEENGRFIIGENAINKFANAIDSLFDENGNCNDKWHEMSKNCKKLSKCADWQHVIKKYKRIICK